MRCAPVAVTLVVSDHDTPQTSCCGCWPVARTPHDPTYLHRRFVTTTAELDRLLATCVWVALFCPACHRSLAL